MNRKRKMKIINDVIKDTCENFGILTQYGVVPSKNSTEIVALLNNKHLEWSLNNFTHDEIYNFYKSLRTEI